jgi:hypothetical protein
MIKAISLWLGLREYGENMYKMVEREAKHGCSTFEAMTKDDNTAHRKNLG